MPLIRLSELDFPPREFRRCEAESAACGVDVGAELALAGVQGAELGGCWGGALRARFRFYISLFDEIEFTAGVIQWDDCGVLAIVFGIGIVKREDERLYHGGETPLEQM